jgi:hypothetical protein
VCKKKNLRGGKVMSKIMRKSFLVILSNLLLAANITFTSVQAYPLDITCQTNKQVYNVGEAVNINGTVTYNFQPIVGALIALQVNDRLGSYILRTLCTGTASGSLQIEITNVYIGDSQGNPRTTIGKGEYAYIYIYYKNNYDRDLNATIAFTIYDANNSPMFAKMPASLAIPPGGPWFTLYIWQIPSDAVEGTATIYASIYTAPPKDGGTPYCPEKSNTINIVKASQPPTPPKTQEGTYATNFQIAKKGTRIGNYTIYVNVFHLGYKASATASYQVILVGDINGDLYVNVKDAVLLGMAFNSKPGDPNWDQRCDLNHDNFINIKDAVILGVNFGNSAL